MEAQIEAAQRSSEARSKSRSAPDEVESLRRREGLLLSRTRVLQELQTAHKERYRAMLQEMLDHLELELSKLPGPREQDAGGR